MKRNYRAVPLSNLATVRPDALISASTDVEAFDKAKEALGEGVAFDLCEGDRLVLSHVPTRLWGTVASAPTQRD